MNQFDSVNNLISRMEAYIISKQVKGTPKSRIQVKVMKKALSWVKESMANITELTFLMRSQRLLWCNAGCTLLWREPVSVKGWTLPM